MRTVVPDNQGVFQMRCPMCDAKKGPCRSNLDGGYAGTHSLRVKWYYEQQHEWRRLKAQKRK